MKIQCSIMAMLLLAGCTSEWDLQGHDPKEYYAKNPKVNKIESRTVTQDVHFQSREPRLTNDERDKLRGGLRDVSPAASQAVMIEFAPSQLYNEPRRTHLRKFLRSLGYGGEMSFEASDDLSINDARVSVTYAAVVLPDCPDWRMSPVTSYSNTWQGNYGCATMVNLGLMVADPRDLVRGSGMEGPDAERNSKVIQDYRAGKEYGPSVVGGGGGSSDASSGGSAPSGQ